MIGFLPDSISDFDPEDGTFKEMDSNCKVLQLEDDVCLIYPTEGPEQNMFVLHNALQYSIRELESIWSCIFRFHSSHKSGTW